MRVACVWCCLYVCVYAFCLRVVVRYECPYVCLLYVLYSCCTLDTCVGFVDKIRQAKINQTTLVTQFWKRRLGPTKTNQTLTESRNWLAGATIKNTKPTITEEIINPPMHIRNSDVRKSSWAETHEQKASRQLRPDNLDHRVPSHGVGGGIKADNKLSRTILWWVSVS